eukprot:1158769-Pelagomonas_calceolata.AAC.5
MVFTTRTAGAKTYKPCSSSVQYTGASTHELRRAKQQTLSPHGFRQCSPLCELLLSAKAGAAVTRHD